MRNFAIAALFAALVLTSCPTPVKPTTDSPDPNSQENLPVENEPTLFVYDSEDDDFLFSVNDASSVETGGSTYWIERRDESAAFAPLEMSVKKNSGYNKGGFGFVFAQEQGGTDDFSCLVVLINVIGEYCVGIVQNNEFDYICEWTSSVNITRGYSQTNVLRIEKQGAAGYGYRLIINGLDTYDFEDPEASHTGGGYGYAAAVTPAENFPAVPVMVHFKEN